MLKTITKEEGLLSSLGETVSERMKGRSSRESYYTHYKEDTDDEEIPLRLAATSGSTALSSYWESENSR